jgi:crossover junction endodeoxyribonuclease RuvC
MPRVIVLGIDPGSRRCGFGVVARVGGRLEVVESGVLVPGERTMAQRLGYILHGLERLLARTRPDEVAVEQVFAGASARSALVLGQARGVALAAAARAGLPVHEYAPSAVKLAFTGSGRAGKAQMIRTARAILGIQTDLADEADAIALAVCHLARRPLALVAAERARATTRLHATPGPRALSPGAVAARALSRLRPSRRDHRGAP